jgi:hypothetical protein
VRRWHGGAVGVAWKRTARESGRAGQSSVAGYGCGRPLAAGRGQGGRIPPWFMRSVVRPGSDCTAGNGGAPAPDRRGQT